VGRIYKWFGQSGEKALILSNTTRTKKKSAEGLLIKPFKTRS